MRRVLAIIAAVPLLAVAACGGDDTSATDTTAAAATTGAVTTAPATTAAAVTTAATTAASAAPTTAAVLRIMVTNDDGIAADGIDVLVNALRALPATEVSVAAPAENQSGSSDKTTPGGAPASPATTKSGVAGTAVAGFPADSVNWALDGGLPARPHVVVSGVNPGQNIGPFSMLSGTVGAARTAARRGVPALAVSAGLLGDGRADLATGARLAVEWVEANRASLLARSTTDTSPVEVVSINYPTCPTGALRGMVDVPTATDFGTRTFDALDCTSSATAPADDVDAFLVGFASRSRLAP